MNKQDYISYKIKKLKEEGVPQQRAVAIAINMEKERKMQFGGLSTLPNITQLLQSQTMTPQQAFNPSVAPSTTPSNTIGNYINIDPNNNQPIVEDNSVFNSPEQLARMQNNNAVNTLTGNYDSNGQPINTNPVNVNTQTNFSLYNPYQGISLENALFNLGQSLNYKGDNTGANTVRGIGSAGKVLFGGARTLLSGAGYEQANSRAYDNYRQMLFNPEQKYQYLQEGGTITNAQALTGAYLPETQMGNAELEHGEVIQQPMTGDIQKVVGETHENGGVEANLENGTKVLSDHTKVGAANAKTFRNEFDIRVKATDTFAKVMDKYNQKIGWNKLVDEEAKAIEQVGNQDDTVAADTKDINLNFLSEKLQEIQIEKETVKELQDEAFNTIFNKQEKIPKKGDKEKMQQGGTYDEAVIALAQQYNLPPERVLELLQQMSSPQTEQPMMQQGGSFYTANPYTLSEYGNQPFGSANYLAGNVSDINVANQRIQSMASMYPYLAGRANLTPNLTSSEPILNFQKGYNDYADAALIAAENNPNLTDAQKEQIKTQIANERFTNEGVRGFDGILGNFTTSRGTFSLPLLTEEDKKKYPNIKFVGDVFDGNGQIKEEYKDLAPNTIELLKNTYEKAGNNVLDVGLLTTPTAVVEGEAPQAITPQTINRQQNVMGVANLPVDFTLPPSPMQDVYKADVTLGRIDPVKLSLEPNLIEADRQNQAAIDSLGFLPDSQRAAAIGAILGQTQNATNQAITQAETVNAQAQFQADQINMQQADKQQLLDAQFAGDYEQRALGSLLNSQRDLRAFFTQNSLNNRQNFADVRDLNLLNQMFPNYATNGQQVMFNNAPASFVSPASMNTLNYANLSAEQKRIFDREIAKVAAKNASKR